MVNTFPRLRFALSGEIYTFYRKPFLPAEKPVCYNNVIHSESSRLKIPKVLDWNVNSQRKCIYSPFIVTFMWIHLETVKVINLVRNLWKLFGGIPKIGFLSIQLRAQASISLYIKKTSRKILSEVAIFKMDIIKSYHVNYYQCQLSYQGWKNCKLVGGFNDRKDRRWTVDCNYSELNAR